MYILAANAILLLHLAFICLVLLGGLAVARWPRLAWIHVPAATWGFLVEVADWYCPLTDVENYLLRRAGEGGYAGDFLERGLLAVIYPEGLTREVQIGLGLVVLTVNAVIYGLVWKRARRRETPP